MPHAKFSPSSAHRWLRCPGSIEKTKDMPSTSSWYADEGTAAHELAAFCLEEGTDADNYIGQVIQVKDQYDKVANEFTIDDEMASYVQVYVDSVRDAAHGADAMMVEQSLDFSEYIGYEGQKGTGDCVIIGSNTLEVHDLKYGKGEKVFAKENEQEMLYALGAIAEFSMVYDFDTVKLVIHQPRLDHIDEWEISVESLETFAARAGDVVEEAVSDEPRVIPGPVQCKWCPAKPVCKEAAEAVEHAVFNDFGVMEEPDKDTDAEQLSENMAMVSFVRDWAKAVEQETRNRLDNDPDSVPGFKLIEGRAGARKWRDENQAERLFKRFRFRKEDMYSFKLISPTQAEKALKKDNPKRWEKLADLIDRGNPSIAIVPEDDPRPAVSRADDFTDLTGGNDDE